MDRIPCFLQVKQTLPETNSQNTWEWMVGRWSFLFKGRLNFQGRAVSFREGTAISPDFLSLGGHWKTSELFQERWPSSIEELLGEDGWCAKSETMGTRMKPSFIRAYFTHIFLGIETFIFPWDFGVQRKVFFEKKTWTPKIPNKSSKGTFFSKRVLGSLIPLYHFIALLSSSWMYLYVSYPLKRYPPLVWREVEVGSFLPLSTCLEHKWPIFLNAIWPIKSKGMKVNPWQKKELSWLLPWEPTFPSFLGVITYNPYIGGLAPLFFMGFWGPKVGKITCGSKNASIFDQKGSQHLQRW